MLEVLDSISAAGDEKGAFVYRNGLLYMALSACDAFYMHRMAYRHHRG